MTNKGFVLQMTSTPRRGLLNKISAFFNQFTNLPTNGKKNRNKTANRSQNDLERPLSNMCFSVTNSCW